MSMQSGAPAGPAAGMRVLLVVFQWSRAGGLEAVSWEIARTLRDLGAEVTVWSTTQPGAIEVDGIAARGFAPSRGGRVARSAHARGLWRGRLTRAVRDAAPHFDLVVAGHAWLLAPVRRALEGMARRPACWVWAHGIEVWGPAGARVASDLAWADRVAGVSRFTCAQVAPFVSAERLALVHNPVDTALFTPGTEAEAGALRASAPSPPPDVPHPLPPVPSGFSPSRGTGTEPAADLLVVGRLDRRERYKGHDVLLRALLPLRALLGRPATLRVVGDGDWRSDLEAEAVRLGVAEWVRFSGRVPFSDLVEAYRACRLFAMPSRVDRPRRGLWTGEGLGIVFLEAQACGRPVLASREGGAPDTVLAGETGMLVDPRDPESLAAAAAPLLADPSRGDAMGARGRAFVEANFSLPRFRERLERLLESPA